LIRCNWSKWVFWKYWSHWIFWNARFDWFYWLARAPRLNWITRTRRVFGTEWAGHRVFLEILDRLEYKVKRVRLVQLELLEELDYRAVKVCRALRASKVPEVTRGHLVNLEQQVKQDCRGSKVCLVILGYQGRLAEPAAQVTRWFRLNSFVFSKILHKIRT
jgi:hypothetical protein